MQPNIFPDSGDVIGNATGVYTNSNPPYAISDFLSIYPQFGLNGNGIAVVPQSVLQLYINLATASLNQQRWQDAWLVGMGYFVAHFATLYLQSTAALTSSSSAGQVINAAQARGLTTSKGVGDLSKSIDYSQIAQDLDGWAAWKLTVFGQQLATLGKLTGLGAMYIW